MGSTATADLVLGFSFAKPGGLPLTYVECQRWKARAFQAADVMTHFHPPHTAVPSEHRPLIVQLLDDLLACPLRNGDPICSHTLENTRAHNLMWAHNATMFGTVWDPNRMSSCSWVNFGEVLGWM